MFYSFFRLLALLSIVVFLPAQRAWSLPSYDDVLVVINTQSPESIEVGRYFQQQRRIPERNICTISITPRLNEEHMTVSERDAAVTAILTHVEANGLRYRINHVVLTPRIAYFSDNDMVAAYYDMGDHIFDLYLMFMLSDPGVDIFSLNPFYHYVNGNWDNLKEHSFSRRKYGYPIVTRLDGAGTANVRNMIDATGAPAYQSHTNGINFLVSYSNDADIYRSTANTRGAEFIRRGNIRLNEDFFTTSKGAADEPIMNESNIMFAYFNLVNEAGVDDPPFTFWGLNFLPGSMLTAWRSFPTRKLLRTSGGVSRVTVASKTQTEFRREDGADYAYRHLETITVDPVRSRLWAGSGEKQENVWHQFGVYTHQRRGNGLAVLDAGSGALIAHYTQRNSGLLNDRVVKLAYDSQADRLWVACYGGIQYVDLTDNSFHAVAGLTADYAAAYDVYVSPYDTGKVYASFLYEGISTRNSTITDARIKLFEIDKPTGAVTALTISSANGFRPLIAQTAPGTLWNVRDKTLVRYDRATQQAINTVDLSGVLAPDSSDYPRALLAHTNSFGERQVFVAVANALSTPAPQRKNYLVRLVETGPNTLTTNVINLAAWNDTSASANGQSVYIRHLAADPQNPNHIYMALSKQHDNTSTHYGLIMRSTDGRGAVWSTYVASSTTLENLNEIAFDGQGNLFCARGYHNNGQGNVSDFMAFGACAIGGGLDHDYMLYNRARVQTGNLNTTWPDPNEATRVMAGAATNAYTAGDVNYPMGPVMFKVLDGFGCAVSRFAAYKQYPATGGGGHTPFMLVMEPKVAPFAPRPDEAGTLLFTGLTNTLSARLVSPGLPAHMDGYEPSTINADTVALLDDAGAYLAPGAITYVSATREIRYQRPGTLPKGVYYLRLKGGAGGIKNTQGGALTNPRADEFRDEIVLRYTVGGTPGNAAPHADAGPDQAIVWPQQKIFLAGSVSDDRQPSAFPSVLWSKLSGPGAVAFSSSGTALTHATFSLPGIYVLRLAADDGDLTAASDTVVTVQSLSIPSGLVAHWNFEESGGTQANDVSGHAHHATLRGGVTRGAGRLGKGLVCDGSTGHVDAGTSEAFNLTERLTLSAWVYTESAPGAFRGRTVASRVGVGRGASAGPGWTLGAESGDNALAFTVRDRAGGRTSVRSEGFFTEQRGRWAHVVGVFEGGRSVALYVNGALAQRTTDEVPAFLSYEPGTRLTLGCKSTGGDALHGRLDDVRLYGHALGASEIAALHETGIAANAAPIIEAGADITVTWPTNSVLLAGTVTDDGQPVLPDRPSVRWSQSGGSGTVTFARAELSGTRASFSQIGTYELQLDATDGELAVSDRMTVTVQAPPAVGYTNFALNQPASAYSRRIVDGIDYNAAKAVDGNRSGVTNKWWTNNELTPRWFQVGLGGFQTINEVRLDCQDLTGTVGTLYNFEIRLHRGAEGYMTVFAVTNNSAPTVIAHFESTVCSNVYVSITRNATDIFLYELEAYYKELAPDPVASTPTIALSSPADATILTWGQNATLTATVTDPSNLAARVEFYSGAIKLGEDTTAPYGFTWGNPQSGVHSLRARVVDIHGRESLSAVRTLTVNRQPMAALTSPADGAIFLQGEPMLLEAAASDPDDEVVSVTFQADNLPLGSSGSPPYGHTWVSAELGSHTLRAVATDTCGASCTSAVLTVTVSATNIAPAIVSSPTNLTVFAGQPARFAVWATGTQLVYQWYRNGTSIPGATGATYTIPLTMPADDASRFSVAIFNAADWVVSGEAVLTINDLSRHALPYREAFERFAPGILLPGFEGWSAGEAAAGRIVNDSPSLAGLLAYNAVIGYPLRHEAHTQAAVFDNALTNALTVPSGTAVWCDMMVYFAREGGQPPPVPADMQCALFLDDTGRLNVWHRDLISGTNRWSGLAWQTAQTSQWARVTLHLDYATLDAAHNARYFQLFIDGVAQSNALAYTTNNGFGAPGGPWFALSAAPEKLNGLLFDGNGTLDDLTVDTARPLIGLGPHGTPEWWLADNSLTNGLGLALNELADDDRDGFLNWKEYAAGTSPTNDASLLRFIDLPGAANNRLALVIQTVPGRRYTLEGSATLEPDSWEAVAFALTSEGASAVQAVTATEATLTLYVETEGPGRFYRVQTLP